MIEVNAAITKAGFAESLHWQGFANREPCQVGGVNFEIDTIRYVGFVGRLIDGLYRGKASFLIVEPETSTGLADFTKIPGVQS